MTSDDRIRELSELLAIERGNSEYWKHKAAKLEALALKYRGTVEWYAEPSRWRTPGSQHPEFGPRNMFDPPEQGDDMRDGWEWAEDALDVEDGE